MRAAEATEPIADGELDSLFSSVADAKRIALAISGGADSLALLDCTDRWRKRGGRPQVIVFTVDHGLRKSSVAEAAEVAELAKQRGLKSRVLVWKGPHPTGDIEAEARAARYRLLLDAVREEAASHLLLAHHRDDQAETFLIRLARGSGLFGLAAMRREVSSGDVTVVRPFLDVPRTRLLATTAAAGLKPVDDPMNRDPRFLRARIRRLMPLLAAEGFEPALLAATARRLASAADAIDVVAGAAITRHVSFDALAIAWVGRALFDESEEIRLRVLSRLLAAIGGEDYPPRFERLASLERAMAARRSGRFKRTLAGVVVEGRGERFALYREIGRTGLPLIPLKSGRRGIWDHRFAYEAGAKLPADLILGALGEEGRRTLSAGSDLAPVDALAALPAVRRGKQIVAVPSLGYGKAELVASLGPILARRAADPPRFPDPGRES